MKTGIELIGKERGEQIEKHGRTLQSDVDINRNGELIQVARYLLGYGIASEYPLNWSKEFKFHLDRNKTGMEKLIIAGALIAAEIDRLHANELIIANHRQL